ncbi:MAG TPA: glutathione S-transferase family protein [Burkholderiaceae bacterium]|nr:glutathione S-transferase family protein [Burkholderiaceae bacterium]
MKLYYLQGACPLTIQIALEWMEQPYELEEVAFEELKSPNFLALNPLGSVPVFIDEGFVLTQCVAILEYLYEKYPGSGLLGDTLQERADARRWLNFCNSDLHRTFSMVFGVGFYSEDPAIQELLINKTIERLKFLFEVADKQLEGKDYLIGKRTYADAYLYVLLTWTKMKEIDLSSLKNIERFFERMSADPAVRTAREKQGLPV